MGPSPSCSSGFSDIPSSLQDSVVSLLSAWGLTAASLISILGFHSHKSLYQLPLRMHVVVSQACCWLTKSHWQNAFKHVSCLAFTSCSKMKVASMPTAGTDQCSKLDSCLTTDGNRGCREKTSACQAESSSLCLWDRVLSVQVLTKDRPVFPHHTTERCNWACS